MFGFFGKSYYVAPAPATTTPVPETTTIVEVEAIEEDPQPLPTPEPEPAPAPTPAPTSESDEIRSHLRRLQEQVRAKKSKKEAKIRAIQMMQAKQAAYGRDTQQKRAKKAGYVTESEKLMGGRTGYGSYSPYGRYSRLGQNTEKVSADVIQATKVVEQVTKDVNAGMATRSELQAAMISLNEKIRIAEDLAKKTGQLKGYGEEEKSWSPLWVLLALGALYYFLMPKG